MRLVTHRMHTTNGGMTTKQIFLILFRKMQIAITIKKEFGLDGVYILVMGISADTMSILLIFYICLNWE